MRTFAMLSVGLALLGLGIKLTVALCLAWMRARLSPPELTLYDPAAPRLVGADGKLFPLRWLKAEAHLTGPVASVTVRQQFANHRTAPIEAIYQFPLPGRAAVYAFRLKVGEKVIEGQVIEKSQAREVYRKALASGRQAGLLEQQRDNVFTVSVGNLMPGQRLTVEISYAERLEMSSDEWEFRFPVLVASRFSEGATDLQQNPRTGERAFFFGLKVRIDTGGRLLGRLDSGLHKIVQTESSRGLRVELARVGELPNREFVPRYSLQQKTQPGVLFECDGHFLLLVNPTRAPKGEQPPRDVVFLVDRSGSMLGSNWTVAQEAMGMFLAALRPHDRFSVLAFDDQVECFHPEWSPANAAESARGWLKSLQPRGGTHTYRALEHALQLPAAPKRAHSLVLITDGQVTEEAAIYTLLQTRPTDGRLFALGIDNNVNDALLRHFARLGGGSCELVQPHTSYRRALQRLADDIFRAPVARGLEVRGTDLVPGSVLPSPLPPLFAQRALVALGQRKGDGALRLVGENGFELNLPSVASQNPALSKLWARERITWLEDRMRLAPSHESEELRKQLVELSVQANVVSSETSFVAAGQEVVTSGHSETVRQPSMAGVVYCLTSTSSICDALVDSRRSIPESVASVQNVQRWIRSHLDAEAGFNSMLLQGANAHKLLRWARAEGVPIVQETLCEVLASEGDPELAYALYRFRVRERLVAPFLTPEGELYVVEVEPSLLLSEELLGSAVRYLLGEERRYPVLVPDYVRSATRAKLGDSLQSLTVLASTEVPAGVRVVVVATVGRSQRSEMPGACLAI